MLTSFDGETGLYSKDGDPVTLTFHSCVSAIRDCPNNRQGVHEGDMSDYKKAQYFEAYIDSYSVMHAPLGEGTAKEAIISTADKALKPLAVIRPMAYNTLMGLKFGIITTAVFADTVIVSGNGNNLIVRDTDITIPGILSVMKGTKNCTQQVNIGEVTVMKYESNNFDFYQYGDNLIKASKGTDVSQYITLKSLK